MGVVTPRTSRNIEKSSIDYIREQINANWSGVNVVKTFKQVTGKKYPDDFPVICVRIGNTTHSSVGLGSNSTKRNPIILIDIFATSNVNRLDLKDFLIEKLRGGWTYYVYTYENGAVKTKVESGRISLISPPSDEEIDTGIDIDRLDCRDRYRHLISMSISTGKVEV